MRKDVQRRDQAVAAAVSAQLAEEDPGNVTHVHSERVRGVREVICGDALPADLPTVTCKFIVRYATRDAYQVARLLRKDGVWEIDEALTVTRERR